MAQKPQGTGQDKPGDDTRQHQQQAEERDRAEERIERTRRDILGSGGRDESNQAR
jgi:hypothetical protein